jgi:hypothetical protein
MKITNKSFPALGSSCSSEDRGSWWPTVVREDEPCYEARVRQDSVVGMAVSYGLDGPEMESPYVRISRTRPERPWGQTSLLYDGYQFIPGGKAAAAWH